MKKIKWLLPIILMTLTFTTCARLRTPESEPGTKTLHATPLTESNNPSTTISTEEPVIAPTLKNTATPEIETFPDLYDCKVEMRFNSGPLQNKTTKFVILGRAYFADKGERFFPGKNTAVFYEAPKYIILHSAYDNGNLLKPLEAEFIRFYLESWGDRSPAEIQHNINVLLGTEVSWYCDEQLLFQTKIIEIARLSSEASEKLWLEPQNLINILENRSGLQHEWVGEITPSNESGFFLGFCGWGPEALGAERIYHYRYLMRFDILP